ncbi:PilZ domain-containing protein [Sphingomonas sp. GlSt437]|uniref:PilZ domain-containing protein n=1 Tax=Sphingomonas sp. GlSt437 TaxID=3389970 RepID=UPI003A8A132D
MGASTFKYRRPEPALVEQRSIDRHPVFIRRAAVQRGRAKAIEARLEDVSIFGCKLACAGQAKADERVFLSIQGGMPIAATIVWADKGMIGCRFDTPISGGMVRALTLGL